MTTSKKKSKSPKSKPCSHAVSARSAALALECAAAEAALAAADLIRMASNFRAIDVGACSLSERDRNRVADTLAAATGKLRRSHDLALATTGALLPPNHAERCDG